MARPLPFALPVRERPLPEPPVAATTTTDDVHLPPVSGSASSPTAAELRWTVHPAGRQPGRAVGVAGIVVLATLLSWSVTGSLLMGVFALVILAGSLRAWFLPRTYVLDAEGAAERGPLCLPRRLGWSEVRRVSKGASGIHLSPRHTDSRLLPDHGLLLRTGGNRDEVLAVVDAWRSAS
jgi:hypothetical protein